MAGLRKKMYELNSNNVRIEQLRPVIYLFIFQAKLNSDLRRLVYENFGTLKVIISGEKAFRISKNALSKEVVKCMEIPNSTLPGPYADS